jgi:hypothetical protein
MVEQKTKLKDKSKCPNPICWSCSYPFLGLPKPCEVGV